MASNTKSVFCGGLLLFNNIPVDSKYGKYFENFKGKLMKYIKTNF